jgi:hypothetical protein
MRDLFDAIEQLSLLLSLRVGRSAERKGWASKGTPFSVCPAPGRSLQLTGTLVHLPLGAAMLFTPREGPEPSGEGWVIDLRRSGGVLPESWSAGMRVAREGSGWGIHFHGALLSDEAISALLDEIGLPEPSGMGPWLVKLWALRFGLPPDDLRERLAREDNIKRLDHIHAALQRAGNADEARASLEALLTPPEPPRPAPAS